MQKMMTLITLLETRMFILKKKPSHAKLVVRDGVWGFMPQLLHNMYFFDKLSKNSLQKLGKNNNERMLSEGFHLARTRQAGQVYKFGILCTLCH